MSGSHGADRKKTDPSDQARLRALDAMLGGVAHDLNNALSVVLMNLDVMQADQALTGKHAKRIDGMLDAMTGASTLVRYLLSFSHARRPEIDIMSLSETLPPLAELLEAAVGRDIDVVIGDSEAGPCCIMADAATLEIALAHAAMQLAEAMPSGGTITFALSAGRSQRGGRRHAHPARDRCRPAGRHRNRRRSRSRIHRTLCPGCARQGPIDRASGWRSPRRDLTSRLRRSDHSLGPIALRKRPPTGRERFLPGRVASWIGFITGARGKTAVGQ